MGEVALRSLDDAADIDAMVKNGSLKSRQNPDSPERTQYPARPDAAVATVRDAAGGEQRWMGEVALRSLDDAADIDAMVKNGSLKSRQNPDFPKWTQYSIRLGAVPAADQSASRGEKAWIGEEALRRQYDNAAIDAVQSKVAHDVRRNPDRLDRKKFSVNRGTATGVAEADEVLAMLGDQGRVTEGDFLALASSSNEEFKKGLVRSCLREMDLNVWDEDGLSGFVTGIKDMASVHSLSALKDRLLVAPWVGPRASELDYLAVAQQGDDMLTKKFVRRVLGEMDLEVLDEGGLTGFIPWFSGTAAKQSLRALKEELAQAWWVGGRLTNADYLAVAQKDDPTLMKKFVRRVLREMRLDVSDMGGLNGFVPWFTGKTATQSLRSMKEQVMHAPWAVPMRV